MVDVLVCAIRCASAEPVLEVAVIWIHSTVDAEIFGIPGAPVVD